MGARGSPEWAPRDDPPPSVPALCLARKLLSTTFPKYILIPPNPSVLSTKKVLN